MGGCTGLVICPSSSPRIFCRMLLCLPRATPLVAWRRQSCISQHRSNGFADHLTITIDRHMEVAQQHLSLTHCGSESLCRVVEECVGFLQPSSLAPSPGFCGRHAKETGSITREYPKPVMVSVASVTVRITVALGHAASPVCESCGSDHVSPLFQQTEGFLFPVLVAPMGYLPDQT